MIPKEKHYEHYGKCKLPIRDCIVCRFVYGNLTLEQQEKFKKELEL